MHETDDDLSLLGHSEAVLRIVEPLVIGVKVHFRVLRLFISVSKSWVRSTMSDTFPFSMDRELSPGAWEDLANVDLIIVCLPVLVLHPPVTIVLELIVKLFSKLCLVIPSFVFITEATIPLARAGSPRIPDANKL